MWRESTCALNWAVELLCAPFEDGILNKFWLRQQVTLNFIFLQYGLNALETKILNLICQYLMLFHASELLNA